MWDNTRETHEKQHNVLNETHHLCKLQKVKEDIKGSLDMIIVKMYESYILYIAWK
jgi:tRNA(Phe) wybutosine-synthesizing methylase Tyw3